ncbi:MAG: phosphopantetheine-binding protein [Patescibacteria group bacterium]|nr:phosphopantetheine-binding protein [Patescibacteria group bacterium]
MDNNKTISPLELKVKKSLADYLGIETEDISLDDSFKEDLHMQATDLADFLEHLSEKGLPTDQIDIVQIQTVGELIELLNSEDSINLE